MNGNVHSIVQDVKEDCSSRKRLEEPRIEDLNTDARQHIMIVALED
jgi:hypothetical protein